MIAPAARISRETLRRFPVAPDVPRCPLRDVEVAGHAIPAGAMVLVLTAPLQLDPAVWTEPRAFDPDRFAPGRAEDRRRRGASLPFGAGAHACIGAQLASLEATAFRDDRRAALSASRATSTPGAPLIRGVGARRRARAAVAPGRSRRARARSW